MYRDRRSLVDGYAKSLWSATGSPGGAVALSSFLGLTYVVPPLAGLFGACLRRRRLALIGALGYVAGVLGRVISARRTGGRVVDSAFHPLSIASLVGLLVVSWRRKHHGTIRWKGRSVEAAHHEPGRSLSSEIQR